jgi:hypothetical protein
MFNLLVSGRGWAPAHDDMFTNRVLEFTDSRLKERFTVAGRVDFSALCTLPTLFMDETSRDGEDQFARVGTILRATEGVREVTLEYVFDSNVPPLSNATVSRLARDLGIDDFEFSRTHWAVKDADLYRILLHNAQPRRPRPRVFTIADPENIEPSLVSVMMPFHPHFDSVYGTLKSAAESVGLHCRRADDIWENPAVMQDVVSLIDRSHIVICDCTGRNPNVFYEIGIAHTLGRDVLLITQNEADIPFDLRHLRFVHYLNNGEGLKALAERLMPRLTS